MRVVVAAIGSRGDVVPLTHLARRFLRAGHEVVLVTHDVFTHLVGPGVVTLAVAGDPDELLSGPAARAVRRLSPRQLNRTRDLFAEFLHSAQGPAASALRDADVLVASTFAIAAVDEAERHGVPVVRAHMWPEFAGLDGPMPLLPYEWRLPAPGKRVARAALRRAEPYLGGLDGWWERGRLRLVARHPVGLTTSTVGSLYAFSPRVVPDRPDDGVVTGWWTDPTTPQLSQPLSAPIDQGDHGDDWIYVGFGSMTQSDPARLVERLGDVCDRLGVQAVVQIGTLRGRPHPRLLCVGEEPHDALFRRVRAVVHHGGAGTTSAAVRAGVPSVVVPHFADQFYWGHRLHALGVAAAPLPRAWASERALVHRLETALDSAMARRAGDLSEEVRREDGTGRAVEAVEAWTRATSS